MVQNMFPNLQFGNDMFQSQIGTRKQIGPKLSIREQSVPFTDRNLELNSPNSPIWEQCVPFTDRNSEQNSPKCPTVEQTVPFIDRNSEQNSRQFGPK